MKIASAPLIDLTVPEVSIAQHLERGHQDCAQYHFYCYHADNWRIFVIRQNVVQHPFDKDPKVRLDIGCSALIAMCGVGKSRMRNPRQG